MLFDPVRPHTVLANRTVGPDAFVLSFERRYPVKAGRHINVGLPGSETRPYSLYSGEHDSQLEILVRRVEGGRVSPQLATLQPGDNVMVEAPRGRFTLGLVSSGLCPPGDKLLFLCTGTGIAPYRSYLRSHPDLDYTLVHGVRDPRDNFGAEWSDPARHVLCVSGPEVPPGAFSGRVTSWLDGVDVSVYHRVYLCGNAKMILEVLDLLARRGFDDHHIQTETYF